MKRVILASVFMLLLAPACFAEDDTMSYCGDLQDSIKNQAMEIVAHHIKFERCMVDNDGSIDTCIQHYEDSRTAVRALSESGYVELFGKYCK